MFKPEEAYIERVFAMSGQGVTSVFSFGRSLGAIEGVIAARSIKTTLVTPQVWQKAMGVSGGKDGARARAMEVFPHGMLTTSKASKTMVVQMQH
jgi:crossover junction endodeoxyribonuclease RuvC